MRSTFTGINTAYLGLAAQQVGLDTVGHNIANASTTGYSRQTVTLTTTNPNNVYANGYEYKVGTGVTVQSLTRARDSLIDVQYWQQNSAQSYWQNNSDLLGKLEDIFHDSDSTGLLNAINNFSTSLRTLASDAGDTGARTNVREMANALVQSLKQDDQHVRDLANDITSQISTQVDNINSIASQIATLNKQINTQEAFSAKANDLRDQRDNLVDQLSAIANVQVYEQDNGMYTISMSGVTLVQGDRTEKLIVNAGHNDRYNFDTSTVTIEGISTPIKFSGGKMQSLFDSRDTMVGFFDDLDSMAQFLMQDFNAQHKAGVDDNGDPGRNFFGQTGIDYEDAANDPTAGDPPKSWLSQLAVNSDFYTADGLKLIAARDVDSAGSGEGTNANKLSDLLLSQPSGSSPALGKNSLIAFYSSMISALGIQSQQARNMTSNQQIILNNTSNWRQSVSGVSMDEEMTNMIKFQQAYGAAAKVMSTMNSMLDTLINGTGVGS